jgi:hypothetical protein
MTTLKLRADIEHKYENPDPRCEYPYDPSPVGYCWSYANHVDGEDKFADMTAICPGCECWNPKAKQPPTGEE